MAEIVALIKEHGLLDKVFPKPLVSVGITIATLAAALLIGGYIFFETFKLDLSENIARFVDVTTPLEYLQLGLSAFFGFWRDLSAENKLSFIKTACVIYIVIRFMSVATYVFSSLETIFRDELEDNLAKIKKVEENKYQLDTRWEMNLYYPKSETIDLKIEQLQSHKKELERRGEGLEQNIDRLELGRVLLLIFSLLGCALVFFLALFLTVYLSLVIIGQPDALKDSKGAVVDPFSLRDPAKLHSSGTVEYRMIAVLTLLMCWWLVRHGRLFLPVQWTFLLMFLILGTLVALHAGRTYGQETIPFWEVEITQKDHRVLNLILIDEDSDKLILLENTTGNVTEVARSEFDKIVFRRRAQLPLRKP